MSFIKYSLKAGNLPWVKSASVSFRQIVFPIHFNILISHLTE